MYTVQFPSLCDGHYVANVTQCERKMYIEQISDLSEGHIFNLEYSLI